MTFVFYDTETTGTNTAFDQILQFAAILTDDRLQRIDAFEVRSRILPWVVPAPGALKVTRVSPAVLTDPNLPSHYQMMQQINERITKWSPTKFIGFNSFRFDEPLLQHALWQTLHNPWLTVVNGNSRLDLLSIVQAASTLHPSVISVPKDRRGRPRFKLDMLAPKNGFQHVNAHDALGDVEATIYLAKQLAERAPKFWQMAVARGSKTEVENLLFKKQPVVVVEYFGKPYIWFGVYISPNPMNSSAHLIARLDVNWSDLLSSQASEFAKALDQSPRPVRSISANKAPLIFSIDEASLFKGVEAARAHEMYLSSPLSDPDVIERIVGAWSLNSKPWEKADYLELSMHEGFPSRADERRMLEFQKSNWRRKAELVRQFEDKRLKQLAQRLVYTDAPKCLNETDRAKLDYAIASRLLTEQRDNALWRCLPSAKKELAGIDLEDPARDELSRYFEDLESSLTATIAYQR